MTTLFTFDATQYTRENFTSFTSDNPQSTLDEPSIRFVDSLIEHARQCAASDIHIEPYAHNCRIRYRQDGLLHRVTEIPTSFASRITTRLKVLAKMNSAERRLPQDGSFAIASRALDVRVSICPTLYGEKVVLRLLGDSQVPLDIAALGLTPAQQTILLTHATQPNGLILLSGPTGSGKTVTLYTILRYLNTLEKNIMTVEDPVEIYLAGVNQTNINPNIGLTFATVLRAFIRQDPDIILIGEIRDEETALSAIRAAQTGHMILSSIHTHSALETISRIHALGINLHDITSAFSLIISQRLIRILCPCCKKEDNIGQEELRQSGQLPPDATVYQAVGCPACHQGYRHRTGIYEFLPFLPTIKEIILAGADPLHLMNAVKQKNLPSLHQAGLAKVFLGITSLAEIKRLLGDEN